jgi:hypothetical protein
VRECLPHRQPPPVEPITKAHQPAGEVPAGAAVTVQKCEIVLPAPEVPPSEKDINRIGMKKRVRVEVVPYRMNGDDVHIAMCTSHYL